MEDDNVNIYDDLCDYDLGTEVEKLNTENETLREQIRSLQKDVEKLTSTISSLNESQDTLKKNISTLYLTAKSEIDRKDRIISDLRSKYDNICFRRLRPGIENKRGREDNFLEGNITKKIKYNSTTSNTEIDECHDKHESADLEEQKHISEDVKTSNYEVSLFRREPFDDNYHERLSRHSEENEHINGDRFHRDNRRRNDNFDDRYHVKHSSRSRSGSRYNNPWWSRSGERYERHERSRSGSKERYERRERNRSRHNLQDNFTFRGERTRMFEDRENRSDNSWKRNNREFDSRDSRSEHRKTSERTGNTKRETPPVTTTHRRTTDSKISENDDNTSVKSDKKQSKMLDKMENGQSTEIIISENEDNANIKTDKKRTKMLDKTENRQNTDRQISEKDDNTNNKSDKKRLRMLDKMEKKIRKSRSTPIKTSSGCFEQTPTEASDRLKEVSRNITQSLNSEHGHRKFQPKLSRIENMQDRRINKHSKNRLNQKNSSKSVKSKDIIYVNLSDEELSDDLIVIDDCSNNVLDVNMSIKSEKQELKLSQNSDGELTNTAIEDVKSSVQYYTDRAIPFELSKDIDVTKKSLNVNVGKSAFHEISDLEKYNKSSKESNYSPKCTEQNKDHVQEDKASVPLSKQENKSGRETNARNTIDKEEQKHAKQNINMGTDNFKSKEEDKCSSSGDLRNVSDQDRRLAVQEHDSKGNKNGEQLKLNTCTIELLPDMDLNAENATQWNDTEFSKNPNINENSDTDKLEGGNVESATKKDEKNETKKRINIISNIDVTPPVKQKRMVVIQEADNRPKIQNVSVIQGRAMSSSDSGISADYERKEVKKQDMDKIERSSNVARNSEKGEKVESKPRHRSLLKEYINNYTRQQSDVATLVEGKCINNTEISSNVKLDSVDKNKGTTEKVKSLPKDNISSSTQKYVVIEKTIEETKSGIQYKKQNLNEEGQGKDVKKSVPNIVKEDNTVKNPKQQDRDRIEECPNMKLYAQSATKHKKNVVNEQITCQTKENDDKKEDNKNGRQLKKEDGRSKIDTLKTDHSTKDGKKTKSMSPKNKKDVNLEENTIEKKKKHITQSTNQDSKQIRSLGKENLPSTTKHMKPAIDNCRKEDTESKYPKQQSSGTSGNSSNVNLAKDKKKESGRKNSSQENISLKQNKKIEENIHPFDLSLNPYLFDDNFSKREKKIKKSTKGDLTNVAKQGIVEKYVKDGQKIIGSDNQNINIKSSVGNSENRVVKENKEDSQKNSVRDTEDDINEERNTFNENKTQDSNTAEESSNGKLVGESERKKVNKNERLSTENLEKRMKFSPKDSINTHKQDMGEKKHSKIQNVESSSKNSRRKKRSKSKEDEDVENSVKGVKNVGNFIKVGYKDVKECSKEQGEVTEKIEDKMKISDQLKEKDRKKNVNVTDMSKKDKFDSNTTCDANPKNKCIADCENKTVIKDNEEHVSNREDDIKKSKLENSTSSEETVILKVMKFSDMQNILRGSIKEPKSETNTIGTKKKSPYLEHDDLLRKDTKKNVPEVKNDKSRKASENDHARKSKESTSDSSTITEANEIEPVLISSSIEDKLYALIGSYSDDSDLADKNVSGGNTEKENVNEEESSVNMKNENKTCDINKDETDNRDKKENKNVTSIFDPVKADVQAVSSSNLRNNQASVTKNTQNLTPMKVPTRRRITPTPVKGNKPICSFENILGKTSQATFPQVSPLHLTDDGEIPVLHLEENHINNLPMECNIIDKNIITLLDTMNISNMEGDIPKIDCGTATNSGANSGDCHLNVSPIKGSKSLTFENVISKVTSTPLPKNNRQSEKNDISKSNESESFVGRATSGPEKICDRTSVPEMVGNSITSDKTVHTDVKNSATIRKRRFCRMVVIG